MQVDNTPPAGPPVRAKISGIVKSCHLIKEQIIELTEQEAVEIRCLQEAVKNVTSSETRSKIFVSVDKIISNALTRLWNTCFESDARAEYIGHREVFFEETEIETK